MYANRPALAISFLTVLLMAALCCGVMTGPVTIKPLLVIKIWLHQLTCGWIDQSWPRIPETIVLQVRTPRVILGALVGMGLGSAGAAMQGLFRNPMAEPYVLGMSSGAAVGACLAMVLGVGKIFGAFAIPILAFSGSTLTIFAVYHLSRTGGRVPTETLLLSGIAVGLFLYAVVSFLKISASVENLKNVVFWLMGSFSAATWTDVRIVALPLAAGVLVLCLLARELDIFQFGEETAAYLGMDTEAVKRLLLVACALVTGASVAVSGIIGFVGLIVPHLVRMLIGPRHRYLLPCSALGGAVFLVSCDTLSRLVSQPSEIPIGIVTAFVGAPYFVFLLKKRKKKAHWW